MIWLAEPPRPELVAATIRLGVAPLERVPGWAAQWLAEDLDGPDLRLLAGMSGADLDEVRSVLPWALAQAGAPEPALAEAARVVFGEIKRMFTAGLADEEQVMRAVDQVCAATGYAVEVVGQPLGGVFVLAGEWDHPGGRERAELRAVISAAVAEQR